MRQRAGGLIGAVLPKKRVGVVYGVRSAQDTVAVKSGVGHGGSDYSGPVKATQPYQAVCDGTGVVTVGGDFVVFAVFAFQVSRRHQPGHQPTRAGMALLAVRHVCSPDLYWQKKWTTNQRLQLQAS